MSPEPAVEPALGPGPGPVTARTGGRSVAGPAADRPPVAGPTAAGGDAASPVLAWATATVAPAPGRVPPGTALRRAGAEVWGAATDAEPAQVTPFRLSELPSQRTSVDEQARVAGYAAGWAAGARAAAEAAGHERARLAEEHARREEERTRSAEAALAVLRSTVEALRRREEPVLAEARTAVHRAAIELAEAVLGVELSDGPHGARAALARALTFDAAHGPFVVRLNPEDLRRLEVELATGDVPALPDGVELRPDPSVAPGDAVAERAGSALDAAIAGALARARAALLGDGGAP